MQNKYKYIIATFLWFGFCFQAMAQTDTVYIYEDVIIYDTVIVYDTVFSPSSDSDIFSIKPKSISLLQLDTLNNDAKLTIISDKQTATFFINNIIVENNIKNLNSTKMKKITFMSLMVFSFNAMVIAQSTVGITAGNNLWINIPPDTEELSFSPKVSYIAPQIGGYVSTKLTDNLDLRLDLQYSYAVSNNKSIASSLDITTFFYRSDFHQLRLPVNVVLNIGRLKPAVGLWYSASKATKKYTDVRGAGTLYKANEKYSLYLSQIGGSVGAFYDLSHRWGLSLNYLIGINTPNLVLAKGGLKGHNVSLNPRSHQINAGITYRFGAEK